MTQMALTYGLISPRDWGLAPAQPEALQAWAPLGVEARDWEERARQATYHWLLSNWREDVGAFAGHYKVHSDVYEEPQLTNLIAPWHCLAAADRYGDADLLVKARRASDWLYTHCVETHPMSVVLGGVHDAWQPHELWTKFVAEAVVQYAGLFARTADPELLRRAIEGGSFLAQAGRHGLACKYDCRDARWLTHGWQSFGRVIEALVILYTLTQDSQWLGQARCWAEGALTLQAPNGCFYLIDGEYYNTDLAADELRALVWMAELTGADEFLGAAVRFADWHLRAQRPDGAWLLTCDRAGNVISPYVGPGDMPNIAVALLRLHAATGQAKYLAAALRAMRYALGQQLTPVSDSPDVTNDKALWGYWSWDPRYDYTMSGDQITHYARGLWFTLDYLATLDPAEAARCL